MYKSKMTGIIRRNKDRVYTSVDVMEVMGCDFDQALEEIKRIKSDPDLKDTKFMIIRGE